MFGLDGWGYPKPLNKATGRWHRGGRGELAAVPARYFSLRGRLANGQKPWMAIAMPIPRMRPMTVRMTVTFIQG